MEELLMKYLSGDTSREENRKIYEWIKQSSANEKKFKSLRRLYDLTLWHDPVSNNLIMKPARTKKLPIRFFVRLAAACLLAAGLFYFYKNVWNNEIETTILNKWLGMQEINVPMGEYAEMVLDDGTRVWLNSRSTLSYPSRFKGRERIVQLTGEGYFDVSHDPERPFKVEVSGYIVQVLGTEFNVRAYADLHSFEASLLEGNVMIRSVESDETISLKPYERAVEKEDGFAIIEFNKDEFLWREGILFINNKTIYEILPLLSQYFDATFIVDEQNLDEHKKYSGKFRISDGIEHILAVLKIQNNFKYEIYYEDKTIIIK